MSAGVEIAPYDELDERLVRQGPSLCGPSGGGTRRWPHGSREAGMARSTRRAGGVRTVGHVLLSRMTAPVRALALAPLAVATDWQRRGIGTALVEAALERARAAGSQAVFVLGDPAYYRRFGFRADLAAGFASPYAGPHLMVVAPRRGFTVVWARSGTRRRLRSWDRRRGLGGVPCEPLSPCARGGPGDPERRIWWIALVRPTRRALPRARDLSVDRSGRGRPVRGGPSAVRVRRVGRSDVRPITVQVRAQTRASPTFAEGSYI